MEAIPGQVDTKMAIISVDNSRLELYTLEYACPLDISLQNYAR